MRAITVNGKKYAEVFGATLSGPIWQQAMKGALANQPIENFQNAPELLLRGPPITIPSLQGQDPKTAAAALTKLGLYPTIVATPVTSSQPAGKVESTNPPAGTTVYGGALVKIMISNGIPLVVLSSPPASEPPGSQLPGTPGTPGTIGITSQTPSPKVTPSPTGTPTH
jgi:beta-lactam-binding protein with PASTA domain